MAEPDHEIVFLRTRKTANNEKEGVYSDRHPLSFYLISSAHKRCGRRQRRPDPSTSVPPTAKTPPRNGTAQLRLRELRAFRRNGEHTRNRSDRSNGKNGFRMSEAIRIPSDRDGFPQHERQASEKNAPFGQRRLFPDGTLLIRHNRIPDSGAHRQASFPHGPYPTTVLLPPRHDFIGTGGDRRLPGFRCGMQLLAQADGTAPSISDGRRPVIGKSDKRTNAVVAPLRTAS